MGYLDALASASRYKSFGNWLERLCRSEYEERKNPEKLHFIKNQLTALREAVDAVLEPSGWSRISYKSAELGVVAVHDEFGEMPVLQLSDGIRNLTGLAGDIASRAIRLNAHLGRDAVANTPGIVLVDEIDMHLHPEWQQTVVESLRAAFPKIQFIFTTHSPQVISTVDRQSLRVLREDEEGAVFEAPTFQTRGVESTDVLARIMGVDAVPGVEEARLYSDYRAMIDSGKHDVHAGLELRDRLISHFGEDHPLMLDCERLIRFQIFKRRRSSGGEGYRAQT